jgi:hypothetical protein
LWRRACPLLIGVLVVRLVLARRRLGEAKAEHDGMPAAASKGAAAAVSAEARATGEGAAAASGGETAEGATGASDIPSECEQAVPSMDS